MSTWDYKGAGMNLAEIEKEIRGAQRLLEVGSYNKAFVCIPREYYMEGHYKLERLCEFINAMIDQDCDIYGR